MHRNWSASAGFSEWTKQVFSFLNFFLIFISLIFVFSELRFDWVEQLVGRYLASTNSQRPKTGAIWDTGRHAANAQAYINDVMERKEDASRSALKADSFLALSRSLSEGEWINLEKNQFQSLYLALDRATARELIEPSQLVWLLKGDQLNRIFCEGVRDGIRIFFLDADNRVIRRMEFSASQIVQIESALGAQPGNIEMMPEFSGRIYNASRFFEALLTLPRDILPDLLSSPEALLRQEGRILRVGVGNESQNGYILLGFEFEDAGGVKVVSVKGREWAVWQLSLSLKGDGF